MAFLGLEVLNLPCLQRVAVPCEDDGDFSADAIEQIAAWRNGTLWEAWDALRHDRNWVNHKKGR